MEYKGNMEGWTWRGCCYTIRKILYPYGFCKKCWYAHGKPTGGVNDGKN